MTDQDNSPEANLPEKKAEAGKEEKVDGSPMEPEILEKLPPEVKRVVESLSVYSGPVFHPILKKINESHITKALDYADKKDQRDYEDEQSSKKYHLAYTIIILVFLGGMTIYLVSADKELYKEVLGKLLPFLAGLASGYGLKAYQDRDKD